jgi:hypothetical protein
VAPDAAALQTAPGTDAQPGEWSNPWEDAAGRDRFAAFAETLQQSLFHPTAFFRRTAPERGAGAALAYAAITGTLSLAVFWLWQLALGGLGGGDAGNHLRDLLVSWGALAAILLLAPLAIAATFVVSAGVQHVALAVLGGATGTYTTTLKAVCYGSSALVFNVFPICGTAVGSVWQVVIQVIGMRELHRTTTARALLAWLLPLVLATCLAGAVFMAAMLGLVKILLHFGDGKFGA